MNTYLYPIYDTEFGQIWIERVIARSLEDAKDKIMMEDEFEGIDWDEYIAWLSENNLVIGLIQDVDEILR